MKHSAYVNIISARKPHGDMRRLNPILGTHLHECPAGFVLLKIQGRNKRKTNLL